MELLSTNPNLEISILRAELFFISTQPSGPGFNSEIINGLSDTVTIAVSNAEYSPADTFKETV